MEEEGVGLVVQDYSSDYPKIGGCNADKSVFYVGSPEGLCPFCARPPDYTMPFTGAAFAAAQPGASFPEAAAEPAEIVDIPSQCPACDAMVRVVITNSDVQIVSAAPTPPAEPSAEENAPLPSAEGSPFVAGSPVSSALVPSQGDVVASEAGEPAPVASETPL
jgi:hypothetical protein